MARSNRSETSDGVVQISTRYGTSSRISSNSNNPEQDYSRVRLTRIRQMARSNRSETSDGVVRISTRYELPNAAMNNHEEHNSNNVAMNNDEEHTNYIEAMDIDEEEDNQSEPMNNHGERRNNIHQVRRMRRARINNNSARDFHEEMGVHDCQLPPLKICPYCNALLFDRETFSLCCLKGNIVLPLIQFPPEMVQLFSDQTD
ncbi:hypothetical protein ABKV19_026940, partial [Rosa sericea]